jgi:hypothetical protein
MSEVAEPKRGDYHCVSLLAAVLLYEGSGALFVYGQALSLIYLYYYNFFLDYTFNGCPIFEA